LRPKLFVIHLLLVGISLVGLIHFSQVFTSIATATASEMKDMELEDEDIKQELEPIETEEIGDKEEEDNTAKQEDEGKEEEEEESDDDIAGTELEEDVMIDDNYSSDDDVPLELPFDTPMPFP
jgi:hypothetical protein